MYSKKQRIAAMIGIILLILLYLATLVSAIFNFDGSGRLFQACLFASIAVPLLLWIYIFLYGKLTGRHTIASFELSGQETQGKASPQSAKAADSAISTESTESVKAADSTEVTKAAKAADSTETAKP